MNEWTNEKEMNDRERNEWMTGSIKGNDWQTNTWKEKVRKIKASWQILYENYAKRNLMAVGVNL